MATKYLRICQRGELGLENEPKTNGNTECASVTYSPSGCHDRPHALRSRRCEKVMRLHLEAFTLECSDLAHSPWSRVMCVPVLTSRDPDC